MDVSKPENVVILASRLSKSLKFCSRVWYQSARFCNFLKKSSAVAEDLCKAFLQHLIHLDLLSSSTGSSNSRHLVFDSFHVRGELCDGAGPIDTSVLIRSGNTRDKTLYALSSCVTVHNNASLISRHECMRQH